MGASKEWFLDKFYEPCLDKWADYAPATSDADQRSTADQYWAAEAGTDHLDEQIDQREADAHYQGW